MSIVLIDLHQQRANNFEQYKSATLWIRGNLMSTKNQNPQNNNPQHPLFPNQMIEQINIALGKKWISQPGSCKPAVGD